MLTYQFDGLVALAEAQDFGLAAQRCAMSVDDLFAALQSLEREFGPLFFGSRNAFEGFTPAGERVLAWVRTVLQDTDGLRGELRTARREAAVAALLARRSTSPKRLGLPAPTEEDVDLMLQAALRAPDHGGLHPWRVIEFEDAERGALADLFEHEKRRRDPMSTSLDLRRAREHATRAPALLAFVAVTRPRSKVPPREQLLGAGAALCNFLNAAHQLGFGAIVLSGDRCHDPELTRALGLQPGEFLAGFISLGTVAEVPPARREVAPALVRSRWVPGPAALAPSAVPTLRP